MFVKRRSTSKHVYFFYAFFFLSILSFNKDCSAGSIQINVPGPAPLVLPNQNDGSNPGATIEKTGAGDLITLNSTYTGPTNISAGRWFAMGPLGVNPSTPITIASGGSLIGSGPVTGAIVNNGTIGAMGTVDYSDRKKNIGTLNITGSYSANSGSSQIVELRSNRDLSDNSRVPKSDLINVSADATITGNHTFSLLLDAGIYKANTVTDYVILQTTGTLTTTGSTFYLNQATNTGLTVTVGVLSAPGQPNDGKKIILKLTVGGSDVVVNADQTESDPGRTTTEITVRPITINPGEILTENISAEDVTIAAVIEQVELTNLVFNTNAAFNDPAPTAVADTFRFKFSSTSAPTASNSKGAMESLLTAISKNGPVSYERNQTRLWITPYANRARVRKTNNDSGNQGWSGGSLIGIEQRDKKNIWSIGIVTGLMASRSYVIGKPNNFSKANGMLLGAFNTLKYTDNKKGGNVGHELLISRTVTSVNAQRDGVDAKDKVTPFYALSAYKTTTDVGNAQLNYLFDVIKKSVTCRLNTGMTYVNTNYGAYREKGAGTNGINKSSSSTKSLEWYNGIGIRKIWNHEKITIRTTFVYEYGYNVKNSGSVATTTTQSVSPTTFTTPPGPRQNKHYIQLNGSYLDRGTGLKFIASYSGALYKNVTNHTGMLKVEYRF